MATFASDIPFRHLIVVNVVVYGVTAIAGRASGPLHVVRRIESCPPVGSFVWHVILQPFLGSDVPLYRQRVVVVANLREVSLLPLAAVDKSHVFNGESCDVVRAEIGDDRIRMLSWVANDIGHWSLPPTLIDRRVALLA